MAAGLPPDDHPRPSRDEVRAYVVDMLEQLARLADEAGEHRLASRIHNAALDSEDA